MKPVATSHERLFERFSGSFYGAVRDGSSAGSLLSRCSHRHPHRAAADRCAARQLAMVFRRATSLSSTVNSDHTRTAPGSAPVSVKETTTMNKQTTTKTTRRSTKTPPCAKCARVNSTGLDCRNAAACRSRRREQKKGGR
jgi:hypothetical protein